MSALARTLQRTAARTRTHGCAWLELELRDSVRRGSFPLLFCVGRCRRDVSDNLLNGTLPDSVAGLTRLKRL